MDFAEGWARLEATAPQQNALEGPTESTAPAAVSAFTTASAPPKFQHYRPFSSVVDDFISEAQDEHRIYLGVPELDAEMRGMSSKHLLLLNGAPHGGKTLFTYHILRHNPSKRVAWFTPDESGAMVLASLASMQSGVQAAELEQRIKQDDQEARELLRRVATEEFPNLAVFEEPLTPNYLEEALDEAHKAWGAPHELVVIDYVGLLQLGEDMRAKFDYIKSLSKRRGPVIALHQTSRSSGADGRELTITSGEYGGEAYATFVLGVRRKLYGHLAVRRELREKIARGGRNLDDTYKRLIEIEDDIKRDEHTLTVNAVKVKRVGGKLVDEIDFELDHSTGVITPLNGRLPNQYVSEQRRAIVSSQPRPNWRQEEFDEEF